MGGSPSAEPDPVGLATSSAPATPLFLGVLFILLLGLQLLFYRDSFAEKPASDDFLALHQVDRGETEGIWTFFLVSDTGDYRPLQNATYWFFGRFSRRHLFLSLRILHVLSAIAYAGVAFLWIRALKFNRIAGVASACVVFLHPALAGALAGLDNFGRLVVSACVWLGALIAYRCGSRSRLAATLVSLCFVIGLGYMEYAIALIPLAVLATAWSGAPRRFHRAAVMFLSLMAVFIAYFVARVSGIVATTPGTGFLSLEPLLWIKNAAVILVAALFFGNTVPIMRVGSLPDFAWLGLNVTLVGLALGCGLWSACRRVVRCAGGDQEAILSAAPGRSSLSGFLVTAFVVTFFPMVLMTHLSEIYLAPVIFALALVTGQSAHGWSAAPRPLRLLTPFLAVFQIMLASDAIQAKVAGINDAGERTDAMMQRFLLQLPSEGYAGRVAMVFLKEESAKSKSYSVFAMPDEQLILSGYNDLAIHWYRPDLVIHLDQLVVSNPSEVALESYDHVLLWEPATREFKAIKRPAT